MAHPLDLLRGVGELWHVIARKLGSQDLYNLSEAHPYWSTMLERRRSNFQMQLCLPLLAKRDLGLRDLLILRLVSKAWSKSVDHYLQHQMYEEVPFMNEKEHNRTDFNVCSRHSSLWVARQRKEVLVVDPFSRFEENHPRQINAWLDSIELTPSPTANPILSREAQFYVASLPGEVQNETTEVITRCLRAHGTHLLRGTFDVDLGQQLLQGVNSFEREYSQLRDWLNLVPNLISLEVDFGRFSLRENEAGLVTHIETNPLPELPSLSRLRVEGLPPAILQALLQRYNQVKTLELGIIGIDEYRLEPVQLENLNTLKLECGAYGLLSLQQARTESWLVGLHTLEIGMNGYGRNVRWGVLIDFLNSNFGAAGRLVKVALQMPTYYPSDQEECTRLFRDSQTCRLRLPGVEQIKLVARNLFGLEFLLPMRPTLKKLAILNHHEKVMDECQQLVQWNGWLGTRLLTSNIWEAFPHLNFIRVQRTNSRGWTYRRKEGGAVVNIHSYGEEIVLYEENVDWEEAANGNGDAEELRP